MEQGTGSREQGDEVELRETVRTGLRRGWGYAELSGVGGLKYATTRLGEPGYLEAGHAGTVPRRGGWGWSGFGAPRCCQCTDDFWVCKGYVRFLFGQTDRGETGR